MSDSKDIPASASLYPNIKKSEMTNSIPLANMEVLSKLRIAADGINRTIQRLNKLHPDDKITEVDDVSELICESYGEYSVIVSMRAKEATNALDNAHKMCGVMKKFYKN
jgi:hypothetical protein